MVRAREGINEVSFRLGEREHTRRFGDGYKSAEAQRDCLTVW